MPRTLDTPNAGSRLPPAPIPPERSLGFLAFLRALADNPIAAWPRAAYEEPYLNWRGGRLRPDLVFVTDPAMVRHVLLDRADVYDKGDVVRRRLAPALGNSVLIAPEAAWRGQRRVTAPFFAARRLDAFEPVVRRVAEGEADRLAVHLGTEIDMHAALVEISYRIVSAAAFSDNGVEDPAAFSRAIATYFDSLGRVDLASYLGLPAWAPTLGRLRARPAIALFRREIGRIIAKRAALIARDGAARAPDDLLTALLTAIDPKTGSPLSPDLVQDNALTFLAAGHETTANALAWTLFLLSEHPAWERRVAEEVAVAGDDIGALVATRMVVEEALRLYPPAPLIPRQALVDDDLRGLPVRAGALVFTSPFVSQRHAAHWDEPAAFRPERFAPGRRQTIDRFVYFPFGAGPRVCMGAGFAMLETLVALSSLLRRYRFVARRPEAVFPKGAITLGPAGGLQMRVEKRSLTARDLAA